jgi:two-component system, OmpR family, response regulator
MTIRVLYVDDEPDLREIAQLALMLDPEIDVRCCSSGMEAVTASAEWQPDLVLLDVMMPGMDGPTTLAHLRQQSITAELRVVFITARTQAHEIKRFLALGAAGVISKPFDPMTLAQQTKAFLKETS